jgi:hypothetical protein
MRFYTVMVLYGNCSMAVWGARKGKDGNQKIIHLCKTKIFVALRDFRLPPRRNEIPEDRRSHTLPCSEPDESGFFS